MTSEKQNLITDYLFWTLLSGAPDTSTKKMANHHKQKIYEALIDHFGSEENVRDAITLYKLAK